jgi:hypothetical protein
LWLLATPFDFDFDFDLDLVCSQQLRYVMLFGGVASI